MIKRNRPRTANHERWLVSYADFITLLFAFFVVLYSSAQVDKRRVGELAVAIQSAFQELGAFSSASGETETAPISATLPHSKESSTAPIVPPVPEARLAVRPPSPPNDIARLKEQLSSALAREIAKNEVSIWIGPDGLVLSLREVGFFDSGSAEMRPQALESFTRVVRVLRAQPHRLRIEGHTDNVPIHTSRFASNWELSTARATEVVRLLITKYSFAPDRLSAAGYGEFHPIADNSTFEGRESNRRVDLVVLSEKNRP